MDLTTVSSCNSCTFFVGLLFTSLLGLPTMILDSVFFRVGVVITFL